MNYKFINSNIFYTRVYDQFNIKGTDWEGRMPYWVARALEQLHILIELEDVVEPLTISEYKASLPCDIKLLRGVELNGYRLKEGGVLNHKTNTSLDDLSFHDEYTYELSNGWITLHHLEEGTINLHYKRVPVEFDNIRNLYFPLVPDNEDCMQAIDWFILKHILSRGYKHPVFSLSSNNPLTNPEARWRESSKIARNSLGAMDSGTRRKIYELLTTFVVNQNAYNNEFFDNTNAQSE